MEQSTTEGQNLSIGSRDILTDILRRGAEEMLAMAIENEVAEYIARHAHLRDGEGRRLVVRNGHLPARTIQTGIGDMAVRQPRVNDKRIDSSGRRVRFSSSILPPYLRRTKSVEELIPWLYLKGVSTGDFTEALQALLGPQAQGLSATNIVRLKTIWQQEWAAWSKRSLEDKQYVYVWADGIHFNIRLEDPGNNKQCILVLMGATADGRKELIAIADGYRESTQSWRELLLDAQKRGLRTDPKVATGDGALGFWAALREIYPTTEEQRCWVHKTANVLNKMPKAVQPKAKSMLHDIWLAETRKEAEKAFDLFVVTFQAKYPKAVECLVKDRDVLLTFYDFPAEHWVHLRTTNPIESTFATVRLRTVRTKGCGSRTACLTMVFKLARCAEKHWRKLNGSDLIAEVVRGIVFVDGIREIAA
ncbi:MAG: IS256 family transposase [Phyllobacteriaceae bacterium]|jgi:putative transposase|nr:IS256 family transposase [Phyllobacteriaceae bacterium]